MALLDSPDTFLNTGREPDRKHYRLKPLREREKTRAYTNELIITGECLRCRKTFTGRLEDERHWFNDHHCEER